MNSRCRCCLQLMFFATGGVRLCSIKCPQNYVPYCRNGGKEGYETMNAHEAIIAGTRRRSCANVRDIVISQLNYLLHAACIHTTPIVVHIRLCDTANWCANLL